MRKNSYFAVKSTANVWVSHMFKFFRKILCNFKNFITNWIFADLHSKHILVMKYIINES